MGFWDSLFRSTPVNNVSLSGFTFPSVRSSWDTTRDEPGFSEEFASDIYPDVFYTGFNSYSNNGVFIKETSDIFRLTYDGILARDGAQDIYAVVGYGDNSSWNDVMYYQMHKTEGQTFELLFPMTGSRSINVAFKDGADHWDNNSGRNYTYVNEGG